MNVKFNLLRKANTSYIILSASYDGKRLQTSINEKVEEKNWNNKKQRLKSSCSNAFNINSYLEKIENIVRDIYYQCKMKGYSPTTDKLRNQLFKKLNGSDNTLTFFEFIEDFIERSYKNKKISTIKGYKYIYKDLKEFQKYSKRRLDWDTINIKFYDDYMYYQYIIKGNSQNTFGKKIKTIKTFLYDATKREQNTNLAFQDFKVLVKETDEIYLTINELDKIFNLNLNNNKRFDEIRDLFIVCCYTGLRYSDVITLTKENITSEGIKVFTQKTEDSYLVPILEKTRLILEKYKNDLPKPSQNNLNKCIKEIGRMAGIDNVVKLKKYEAGKVKIITTEKYKKIASHTGRRSFLTNSIKLDINSLHLMKVTGIRKESTFKKYIKMGSEESVKIIQLKYNENVFDQQKRIS